VLKKTTKAKNFFRWQKYVDQERQRHDKLDHALAQLTFEVYLLRWVVTNMFAKKVSEPDYKNAEAFLVKFKKTKKKPKPKKMTAEERLEWSQLCWAAALGGIPEQKEGG
jgi:hypothetical protein